MLKMSLDSAVKIRFLPVRDCSGSVSILIINKSNVAAESFTDSERSVVASFEAANHAMCSALNCKTQSFILDTESIALENLITLFLISSSEGTLTSTNIK